MKTSGIKTACMMSAYEETKQMWKEASRERERCLMSDSGVRAHRREFPLHDCVLRYHPTRGHGTARQFFFFFFACSRRFPKIPELNTCAGDELLAHSEAYGRIGSQKQLREAKTWLHNGDSF